MSDLVPSVLPLDKGLDLQTAKIIAPPGSVLDSLNYEQVDFQGQKRIDGYTRYDGSVLSAFDDYALVEFTVSGCFAGVSTTVSYPVHINGVLWGVTLAPYGLDQDAAYVAVIDSNVSPIPGDAIAINQVNVGVVTSATVGLETGLSATQHYSKLLELLQALRVRVENLPGPIAGLHWFKDRLYAVASIQTFNTLTYITGQAPDGQVGVAYPGYAYTIVSTAPAITGASIIKGTVPTGLVWNGSTVSILAGTPTTKGTYNFTIRVTAEDGTFADWADSVEIEQSTVACGIPTSFTGGEVFPSEVPIVLGSGTGLVTMEYATGSVPDKFEIWMDGVKVVDTGYHGDTVNQANLNAALAARGLPPETIIQYPGGNTVAAQWANPATRERVSFTKVTTTTVAYVRVYAPIAGTSWRFELSCPVAT